MGLRRFIKNYIYRKKFSAPKNLIIKKIKNTNILITGANSGIGLELTKKFLDLNNSVLATYNKSNDNLLKLKNDKLKICQCDQSVIENIDKIKDFIFNQPVNIIINNAGIWGGKNQSLEKIEYENFPKAINVNAVSILKLSEVVLKYSKKNSLNTMLNISTLYSSTEHNSTGRNYVYKGTKSLMNSFSKNLSIDLKKNYNINVFSICPGSVKTKLNPNGILNPEKIAMSIINILENSNEELNGKFIDLNKNILTW